MKNPSHLSRRQFLGQASCAALGSTAFFSTLLNLRMASAAVTTTPDSDYRALVCVFLFGGNDSFNVLAPYGTTSSDNGYNTYATVRGNLALGLNDLTAISPKTSMLSLGLRHDMPNMASLFGQGKLAFLSNVGSLVRPITLADYKANNYLPTSLFSHADQQEQWMTSLSNSHSTTGWIGRAADLLQSLNTSSDISMNISLSGTNLLQTGNNVYSYAIGQNGAPTLTNGGASATASLLQNTALNSQLCQQYKNIFEQTFAQADRNSIEDNLHFNNAIASATVPTTLPNGTAVAPYGTDYLSSCLQNVARIIAARGSLGVKRQTFFIGWGGFDYHSGLINSMQTMMPLLDKGVQAFNDSMVALGVDDNVTLFQASDFSRTLTSNGDGADHAWGANTFAVGGDVLGGDVYGTYPDLTLGNPLDTGLGRLIPTTSVDQYVAELALWLGVSNTDLTSVVPNIGQFFTPTSTNPMPIGFMKTG